MTIDDKLELLGYEKFVASEKPLTVRYYNNKTNPMAIISVVLQITSDSAHVTFMAEPKVSWISHMLPLELSFEELQAFADKSKELLNLSKETISYD